MGLMFVEEEEEEEDIDDIPDEEEEEESDVDVKKSGGSSALQSFFLQCFVSGLVSAPIRILLFMSMRAPYPNHNTEFCTSVPYSSYNFFSFLRY
jgi:hypothetical protein